MTQMLAAISFLCRERPFQREPCYAKRNGTVECRLWMLGPEFQFQCQLLPAGWAQGLRVFICETRRRSSHKIVKKRKRGRAYHHAWPRAGTSKMVVIISFREKCLRRLIRPYTLPLWPWIVLPPGMVVQDRSWEAGCRPRHWAVLKRRKQAVKGRHTQIWNYSVHRTMTDWHLLTMVSDEFYPVGNTPERRSEHSSRNSILGE